MRHWIKQNKSFFIFGLLTALCAIYLIYSRTTESSDESTLTVILILLAVSLITTANYIITRILDKILSWKRYKLLRFFTQVIVGLIISLLIINGSYYILKNWYTDAPPDWQQLMLINIYASAIVIPFIALYFGVKFLRAWNQSELETERLMKENTRSQMMSLRNHLDPHFLFNNLNILSSLMDYDIDLSKEYLNKFAEVYRTILKTELSDLISLDQEVKLINAYLYLIKVRWQDAVVVENKLEGNLNAKALPPLSGQMLIENAIKHNVISKSYPLHITIEAPEGSHLIVTNSVKPKLGQTENNTGTGLINIENRYAFFTDKKVVIEKTDKTFKVMLPLLEIEEG